VGPSPKFHDDRGILAYVDGSRSVTGDSATAGLSGCKCRPSRRTYAGMPWTGAGLVADTGGWRPKVETTRPVGKDSRPTGWIHWPQVASRLGRGTCAVPACSWMWRRARVRDSHSWARRSYMPVRASLCQVLPRGRGCRPRTSCVHDPLGSAVARWWMCGNRTGAELGVANDNGQQHHRGPVAGLVAVVTGGQVGGVEGGEQAIAVGQPFSCARRDDQWWSEQV
jgi:hypothetical protein